MQPEQRHASSPPTPLYWLTAGLLLGQLVATAAPAPGWHWLIAAIAAGLGGLAWRRRDWPTPRRRACTLTAAALCAAGIGHWQLAAVLHPVFAPDHVARWAGARLEIRGVIADRPLRQPGRSRLLIAVHAARAGSAWQMAGGLVLVTLREATHAWRLGDGVEAVLALRRPRNFGNPGEFDYEAYLARRSVYVTSFAASDGDWRRTGGARHVGDGLERWRDAVAAAIAANLPAPARTIVAALLIGELPALEPAVRDRYARAGVSHVLSISGLHIGLVAAAAYAIGRWLLARSERVLLFTNVPKLAAAASLAPVMLYAAIAGSNVATLRAEVMGVLIVAAVLLNRPRDWLAPVAAAAAGISLCWPGSLCEISFQLSFAAVLAIALAMPPFTAWWRAWEEAHLIRLRGPRWGWLRWLVLSQGVTLSAILGTAPLTAWHFNQVSLIAPLANPIVVPLLGVATVGVGLLATAAVALAPPLAAPLFHLVGWAVATADLLVRLCAAVPGASLRVVTPSPLELVAVYGLLGAPLLAARRARRALAVGCLLILAGDAAYWLQARYWRSELTVTFLSVGQGDCAVVEFPGSRVMVIDGGGLASDFDVGERIVAPFLWQRKIARLDVLVLSHPDLDHYGGLAYLARAFRPSALWWNGARGDGARFTALEDALAEAGVTARTLSRGAATTIEGVSLSVLHPPAGAVGSDNDRSLTLQLRYGPTALLFPGDLEAGGEAALVAAAGTALHSAVLKVPHHGSRSSSSAAFLAAVAPRLAVASLGWANRFGFPHPHVVEAYARRGIALWRTDRDGAVAVRITRDGAVTVRATRGDALARAHTLDTVETQSLKRGVTDSGR